VAEEIRDPQTYAIIGAAMEVHRQLGHGFLEAVYQEALSAELDAKGIAFEKEVMLPIFYKGRLLQCTYRVDFVCCNEILLELKALNKLTGVERAQVINYLKATGYHKALLLNFGTDTLQYERIVR
jgi:GxxExxY protein